MGRDGPFLAEQFQLLVKRLADLVVLFVAFVRRWLALGLLAVRVDALLRRVVQMRPLEPVTALDGRRHALGLCCKRTHGQLISS